MNDEVQQFSRRMKPLIERMRANKVTPYGSEHCTYTRWKEVISTAAMLLRAKGHSQMADRIDAETQVMERVLSPGSSIDNYLLAMHELLRLSGEIWDYCKRDPGLVDVMPYLWLNSAQKHAG